MKIRRAINLILTFTSVASGGCASTSPSPKEINKFEQINLGDSEKRVENLLGPASYGYEKYHTGKYKTLNYVNSEMRPAAFFTLDQEGTKVIGKSMWVYKNDKLYKSAYTVNEQFKNVAFKRYVPCQTRNDRDEILISEKDGLYISTKKDNVVLVSWATPELTAIRAQYILRSCPRLQK